MNTPAVIIGLVLCVLSAVTCYGVSMVASGLFSRSFYRTYSRILISICCVMLLAPALRWLAATSPLMGAIGLSIAQYLAVAILGYGVYRFNRDYIKRVFLQRTTTILFCFRNAGLCDIGGPRVPARCGQWDAVLGGARTRLHHGSTLWAAARVAGRDGVRYGRSIEVLER